MKDVNKDRSVIYINVALAISIVMIIVFMVRSFSMPTSKVAIVDLKKAGAPQVSGNAPAVIYDIDKVKASLPGSAKSNKEYSDFEEMYKDCDKTNVGGNMVEAWRRVRPEDKARVSDGFNKQIATSKEKLKSDPKDKHAKNILYISEALQKMSGEGFNYNLKNKE